MILIATDEAGYGPKLGPLIVAASAWEIAEDDSSPAALQDAFAAIRRPARIGAQRIMVNDSKAIFKPKSVAQGTAPAYQKLEWVTLAGCRWCGLDQRPIRLAADLATDDVQAIHETPWLVKFAAATIDTDPTQCLVDQWDVGPAKLIDLQTRVITAAEFNRACGGGRNKSDLLSSATLGLVHQMLHRVSAGRSTSDAPTIAVYCDRHGGRRYYSSPLQAEFDSGLVQVMEESKTHSGYHVPFGNGAFTIHFTVKGDSFAPVAFSSMVAKYLREKAMESFNQYFTDLHCGASALRSTAGYPVDADRYLADIAPILKQHSIESSKLVRDR
ncbi:hypothetical protein NHH03_10725 [Stieleria sp. TO1_6]|uniref:hypothetical protein n=1 Tax=Stieleria tagensis TaxID=2956795 RepID=UPI00209AE266|nr:hypothetical protein [Stieleria tagensis]MCO8122213.1 hypothetical protein [Stieleria tagensis]